MCAVWSNLVRGAIAASALMTLSACVASTTPEPPRPILPVAPSTFGAPVPVPAVRKGDNPKAVLARALGALRTANDRLEADREFYDDVRRDASGAPDD